MALTTVKIFMSKIPNNTADVTIIGGGLAGISAAYFLARAGKSVVVYEQKSMGGGVTSKTTAFVTQVIDTQIADLVSMFGAQKTKLIWQSHGDAIKTIGQIVKEEKIDCDFTNCPSYYYANTEKEFKTLLKDYQAAAKLGFNMKLHDINGLPFANAGYLEIPNQGKFKAQEYLKGLAKAAKKYGAKIYEHTKPPKKILAKDVIVATYYPLSNKATFLKKGMYVSYVMEVKIPKGALPYAIYEDTANPYNYFRIDPRDKNFDTMIIGGRDHRAELKLNSKKQYATLEKYIKNTFKGMDYKIMSRWSGPILEPTDGLALIGRVSPHQYVTTAFSGNGMTYSTISATLLCDLITGKPTPLQKIYNPKRVPTLKQLAKKGLDYSQELYAILATSIP